MVCHPVFVVEMQRRPPSGAALADAFMFTAYELQAYQLEPAAVIQADHCRIYGVRERLQTSTTTTPAHHPRPKPLSDRQAIRFKLRRVGGQLRLAVRLLTFLPVLRRRFIDIEPKDFD